jgi:cation:H+ antiporter
MFNIVIIVVMDLAQGSSPMMLMVANSQVFVAAGGMLIMALVGGAIARHMPVQNMPAPSMWTGIIFSVVTFVAFLVINWLLVNNNTNDNNDDAEPEPKPQKVVTAKPLPSLKNTVLIFVVTSAGVVLAALWLLRICDEMSIRPITVGGSSFILGHSFVGSFLLAMATSLPELFVSLGALKLGRLNMSIANIFGSNIMNMAFIPLMHLVSWHAGFYGEISPSSLVMLFASIIMSTLFIVGVMARSKHSFLFLGWEAFMILAIYFSAAILVFRMAAH